MNARGFTLLEMSVIWAVGVVFTLALLPHWQRHLAEQKAASIHAHSSYTRIGSCLEWLDDTDTKHGHCTGRKK